MRATSEIRVGPYVMGERLGAGGMAEVFVARRATDGGLGPRYAIKRILPQLAKDPRFVAMFCDEGRICAALDHRNIVRVVDFGEDAGQLFMAMEYVDGTSCARLLRTAAARGRRFPMAVALYIARDVLHALAYAHEARDETGRSFGIVHRDVSPGNILLSSHGEVKLSDFGIVRSEFIARRTYPGELKGKIGYMAPEQVVGAEVDPRSDLFAVGIVLTELLLTRPLFPGRSEMEILTQIYEVDLRVLEENEKELPPRLVDVLRWALKRNPDDRPASARALGMALDRVVTEQGLTLNAGILVDWLAENQLLPSQSGVRVATPAPRIPALAPSDRAAPAAVSEQDTPIATQPRASSPATVYEVRLSNGDVLGPLGPLQLLESFATRRLPLDAMVVKNQGRPRVARNLKELASVVVVEQWMDVVMTARDAQRHPLDRAALGSFLYGLVARRSSGVLVMADQSRRLAVGWEAGVPRTAVSSDRDLLLGTRLVRERLISPKQLAQATEWLVSSENAADAGAGRLGDVLIEHQWLEPTELLRVLVNQLEGRIVELCKWTQGDLCWVEGMKFPHRGLRTIAAPWTLISASIREGFGEVELRELLKPALDDPLAVNPVPPVMPGQLGFLPSELEALGLARGCSSLGELLRTVGASRRIAPKDVLLTVYIALSSGILVSPGWLPGGINRGANPLGY